MSEYDPSSPAAMAALHANKKKCANWATRTAEYANHFKVPFGTRSDVDDNEFYKLKPGEEDEIECGSMGVPDHERLAMEASVGMHSHPHHPHRMPRHVYGYSQVPPPMAQRSSFPGPQVVIQSPPLSAGFSRRRFTSRAPPPPSLQLPISAPPLVSPYPSAGSPAQFHGVPFHPGSAFPPPYVISPPTSPMSPDGHHSHHRHTHSHHRDSGHRHRHHHHKQDKDRSRSSSRPPSAAAYIYSPPVTPGSENSPLPHGYGSRPSSVVYMPAGSIPSRVHQNMMAPGMRYPAAY